jgi:hypothetical protein
MPAPFIKRTRTVGDPDHRQASSRAVWMFMQHPSLGVVAPSDALCRMYNTVVWVELEAEVNSKGLVEFGDKRWRQSADPLTYPFDSYGPDLFRLRF